MLVGITQRVSLDPYAQRLDALDQRWTAFLERCGLVPVLIPNILFDPVAYAQERSISGLILSGGNDIGSFPDRIRDTCGSVISPSHDLAPERDRTELSLLTASRDRGWPVLGVCRGMQLMNLYYGGGLSEVAGHIGVEHELAPAPLLGTSVRTTFDYRVNSYHRFGIRPADLGRDFDPLAFSGRLIEAFAHTNYRQFGIMWHPERRAVFSEADIDFFAWVFSARI